MLAATYTHFYHPAETATPPGSPARATSQVTHSTPRQSIHAEKTLSSPSKRRYVADTHDIEVVKKMKQQEVELRDRNTVLRGLKPNVCVHELSHLTVLISRASEFFHCQNVLHR